jgi:hypothetical protein
MAHYAFIKDNIVTEVITGKEEVNLGDLPDGFSSWEEYYLSKRPGQDSCKRTSYNTVRNTHTDEGTPFRGNYAGIGYTYDEVNDVFLPPKPFDSWVIDSSIWDWKAPVDYPADANDERDTSLPHKLYEWNEEGESWDLRATAEYDSSTGLWEKVE